MLVVCGVFTFRMLFCWHAEILLTITNCLHAPVSKRTTDRTIVTQIGVAHPDGLSDADVSAKLPESVGASVRLGDATVSFTFGNVFLLLCDDDLWEIRMMCVLCRENYDWLQTRRRVP